MSNFAIDIEHLSFRWPRAGEMLLDIDRWQVAPGSRVFLHGASGSGKSTLLSILAGVNVPTSGTCCVMGSDLTKLSPAQRDQWRADNIGFVFQQFNLIPYLSVLGNVTLPCRLSAKRRQSCGNDIASNARTLLERVGLPATLWDVPAMHISVGQQQRVAAARALIGNPGLLIADEPTSALDAGHQDAFLSLLNEVCTEASATLVFVSHDFRLAGNFDHTVAMTELNRGASHG